MYSEEIYVCLRDEWRIRLVELINANRISAIVTKGLKNKAEPEVRLYCTNTFLTYRSIFRKKYTKKLIGKTDIEDASKKLYRLIQEEARMVDA
jgi:hypothetical protein